MTYEQFRRAYVNTTLDLMRGVSYERQRVLWREIGDLCEAFPEFVERADNEWQSLFPIVNGKPSRDPVFPDDAEFVLDVEDAQYEFVPQSR